MTTSAEHGYILGMGTACLDYIWQVGAYPAEDSKSQAEGVMVQGGGPVATALVAAARLGVPSAYFGTLGDDPAGREIAAGLAREQVDIDHLRVVRGTSSHTAAVLVSRATGLRTVVWHPGTVPPPSADDLPEFVLGKARFLHLDGHHPETALPLARKARALGVSVSLDAGSNYPWMKDLAPLADILIGSARFGKDFTGAEDPERMLDCLGSLGPTMVGITLGASGGLIEAHGERFGYPGFPIEAVDTNGAGDVFHGAFLSALAHGAAARDASIFASAAAALKCTMPGGRSGIPARAKVLSFLRARGFTNARGISFFA